MAVPFFIIPRERSKIYKTRKLLDELSRLEIRTTFGMEHDGVSKLIKLYEPHIEGMRSTAVPVETKIMTYISYLRSGSFQWTLANTSGVCQVSVSRIIEEATKVTLRELTKEVIKFPSTVQERYENTQQFHSLSGFPNVIGLLDGTHVWIIAPSTNEATYVCRKGFHSINTQVITGSNSVFFDVVAKWPGSTHDAFIWSQSSAKQRLNAGVLGDGFILADSGYPSNDPQLMVPIENPQTREQRRFNVKLRSTRSSVERSIGLWKGRFRSMCRTGGLSCYKPEKVCKLIVASVTLHNICILQKIPLLQEDEHFMNAEIIPQMQEE